MDGEVFRGVGSRWERLEGRRREKGESGSVEGGKRKASIDLRTGSSFEEQGTGERVRKRVRILLRTGSELEREREAARMEEVDWRREVKE